jgi:hypothetical protein
VSVSDHLATATVDIKGPALFCSPAGLASAPVSNPAAGMCCYKAKGTKLATAAAMQIVGSTFGTMQIEVSKPAYVCEQCTGTTATEQALQCWKTKDLKSPAFAGVEALAVSDGLATDTVDVSKSALYCAPAALGAAAIGDSAAAQCCYKSKGVALASAQTISADGDLGGTFQVEVSKQSMVCEPCASSPLP